jgi:hypothetical protein
LKLVAEAVLYAPMFRNHRIGRNEPSDGLVVIPDAVGGAGDVLNDFADAVGDDTGGADLVIRDNTDLPLLRVRVDRCPSVVLLLSVIRSE